MRIFLDANILFSAALPNSRLFLLLEILFENAVCLTNTYAVEEARRNLTNKYPSRLTAFERIVSKCEVITRQAQIHFVALPSKDVPILGGAVAAEATHLLTGDEQHFGPFWGKVVLDVKIVSPRMLAEEMRLL